MLWAPARSVGSDVGGGALVECHCLGTRHLLGSSVSGLCFDGVYALGSLRSRLSGFLASGSEAYSREGTESHHTFAPPGGEPEQPAAIELAIGALCRLQVEPAAVAVQADL